jgi:hypothetical protein
MAGRHLKEWHFTVSSLLVVQWDTNWQLLYSLPVIEWFAKKGDAYAVMFKFEL